MSITATQSGTLASAGVLGATKFCSECDNPIHPARLAKHPYTEICARCQEQIGDVSTVREAYQPSYKVTGDFGHEDKDPVALHQSSQWDEQPHRANSGTAKNTGHFVTSERGVEARRDNGRKSWVRRRVQQ